ncbi:30300_t:CDS:2, partial [Gigaspora margarita]
SPAVLQNCILGSSVISHPPITRIGDSYNLENYLNTFLYPASQLNPSIDALKYAIYSKTNIHEQDGSPAFSQIDFTEFKMTSSNQIFCKLDFDSFLLNTTDLSIIKRPIQFFCFTNRIKKTFLTNENLAIWYDEIFFPSLKDQQHSTLDIIHHYPPTFKAYKLKSKKDSGYFFHHPYGLSPAILINLTNSMRLKIRSNNNLSRFDNFFFHIYAKNLKLYTKFDPSNNVESYLALNFFNLYFSSPNNNWKQEAKIDVGIEFVSKDLTTPTSIYWARNSATDLLSAIGTTFTTNVSRSRVDNWLHTYDIAGAAGEAKEPGLQNKIFYAQAYHVEKEAFSASKSTLLEELNEKDAKNNSSKVNKACKAAISIFNEIINTYYGARLEYRIGFDITNQVLTIIQLKLDGFLNTNPFYIIPTHLVSKVKIAKLKTFLNLYNRSFNSSIQSSQPSTFNNKTFRICLLILMKTINQSFDALPNTKKYFGDSSIDNSNNPGTLEIHNTMKQSNTAWLLPEIVNIDDSTARITSQYFQQNQQNQQLSDNNSDNNNCIESIPKKYKINDQNFIEITISALDRYIVKDTQNPNITQYLIKKLNQKGQSWSCQKYLKYYKAAFKFFNQSNSLDLFEILKNRLYLEYQKQRILPKTEENGKFCVTYKKK